MKVEYNHGDEIKERKDIIKEESNPDEYITTEEFNIGFALLGLMAIGGILIYLI